MMLISLCAKLFSFFFCEMGALSTVMNLVLSPKWERRQGQRRINGHSSCLLLFSSGPGFLFTHRLMQINIHSRRKWVLRSWALSAPTDAERELRSTNTSLTISSRINENKKPWNLATDWMVVISFTLYCLFAKQEVIHPWVLTLLAPCIYIIYIYISICPQIPLNVFRGIWGQIESLFIVKSSLIVLAFLSLILSFWLSVCKRQITKFRSIFDSDEVNRLHWLLV